MRWDTLRIVRLIPLHLLRESSLDEAVAVYPDAALIFERNIASLETLGAKGWADLGVVARLKGCA